MKNEIQIEGFKWSPETFQQILKAISWYNMGRHTDGDTQDMIQKAIKNDRG